MKGGGKKQQIRVNNCEVINLKLTLNLFLNGRSATMFRKLTLLTVLMAFVSVPALAGNIPEFDVVGTDSANIFNDQVKQLVIDNNLLPNGNKLNDFSDWTVGGPIGPIVPNPGAFVAPGAFEFFASTGTPRPDDCFDSLPGGYESYTTGAIFPGLYQWLIVLQMAPESDIDLNIRDCVTKQNAFDIWFYAQQTGRWRDSNSQLRFDPNLNPLVAVWAIPGPRATLGFATPFLMDARQVPSAALDLRTLDLTVRFTSKALWEEGIVMALPTGLPGASGQQQSLLREGDMMFVQFLIPFNHPADVRYGVDNVSLKYIGVVGLYIATP
jgi:hypothetical protein